MGDLKNEKQKIESEISQYRFEHKSAAELADRFQQRKECEDKITHKNTQVFNAEREFNAAKVQLRAARQGESSRRSQHLNGNSRSVARTEHSLNQCAISSACVPFI